MLFRLRIKPRAATGDTAMAPVTAAAQPSEDIAVPNEGEIKELYTIIVKLIDKLNGHDKETNKLAKEIAQLRSEVASLYKCMGVGKPVSKKSRNE